MLNNIDGKLSKTAKHNDIHEKTSQFGAINKSPNVGNKALRCTGLINTHIHSRIYRQLAPHYNENNEKKLHAYQYEYA